MTIKKAYVGIIDFLESNKNKKVSTILPEVKVLCESKTKAGASGIKTFLKDSDGTILGILDYYFKRWMPLVGSKAVEYGIKANSPSGFNPMCKKGVSYWTKQQAVAKKAMGKMLDDLENGKLECSDIADRKVEIEVAKTEIVEELTLAMFSTKEELIDYLDSEGFKVEVAEVAEVAEVTEVAEVAEVAEAAEVTEEY